MVLRKKIVKYYGLFLRKVLKKYKLRSFYKYVKKLKRSVPKGHILTYFLKTFLKKVIDGLVLK